VVKRVGPNLESKTLRVYVLNGLIHGRALPNAHRLRAIGQGPIAGSPVVNPRGREGDRKRAREGEGERGFSCEWFVLLSCAFARDLLIF